MPVQILAGLVPVIVGFVLTGVLGTLLTVHLQRRSWAHQHRATTRLERRAQALAAFEQISTLLDKRLYRMRLVYGQLRSATPHGSSRRLGEVVELYRQALQDWNDGLNRNFALVQVHLGAPLRLELEAIQGRYAELGRALDFLLRAADRDELGGLVLPRLGGRFNELADWVYRYNVRALGTVEADGAIPSTATAPGPLHHEEARLLVIGMEGTRVTELQRALRRAGEAVSVDHSFGWETERALQNFQRANGLAVDGLVGSATWKVLPSGSAMPKLRRGASGPIVSKLQEVLNGYAAERWDESAGPPDGDFGEMTEVAVKALQRWMEVVPDGIVSDRTWSAQIDANSSLEVLVGLNFAASDPEWAAKADDVTSAVARGDSGGAVGRSST